MNLKKITKEELETMSYNDIANLILKENKEQSTADLFKEVCKLLNMTKKEYENKIGGFYTSLTIDKRFILLDSGNWDLKENHSVKDLKINAILDDLEDIDAESFNEDDDEETEDEDQSYDENPDDDIEDISEEYKNLVIVDEEDLDITE